MDAFSAQPISAPEIPRPEIAGLLTAIDHLKAYAVVGDVKSACYIGDIAGRVYIARYHRVVAVKITIAARGA